MITVITGTPGAGKTAYCVEKLVQPLIGGAVDKLEDDGSVTKVPIKVYTNINGLLLDHELIGPDGPEGVLSWQDWAKPGSVIVYDEYQRVWPPRPNGSAVPPSISALDTHRHRGVDFILVTQNVMNVDRHIHGLTGRHLHVRRIGNSRTAVVYEWDHANRQLLYSKAISRAFWRVDKKTFGLYKSAELHTKQPRRVPTLLWVVLAAIVATPLLGWNFLSRMQAKAAPPPVAVLPLKPLADNIQGFTKSMPLGHSSTVTVALPPVVRGRPVESALAGCIASRDRCTCSDSDGAPVDVSASLCEALRSSRPAMPESVFAHVPEASGGYLGAAGASDARSPDVHLIEFAAARRQSRGFQ